MQIQIEELEHSQGLPTYATDGSAGLDLRAAVPQSFTLEQKETVVVPCGFKIAIPEGYVGLVCTRSGLASRSGVVVKNSPGVIDSDYRGEVKVILYRKLSYGYQSTFFVSPGDRIAQLVIVPVVKVQLEKVANLELVGNRVGGFGSTGVA